MSGARSPARLRVATGAEVQPPHNLDAERAVVSAVALDPSRLPAVKAVLARGDEWYDPRNRAVHLAVCRLVDAAQPVDEVTLMAALAGTEVSPAYLGVLFDATPALAHVGAHAAIVAECARRRRLVAGAERVAVAERIGDPDLAAEALRALDEARAPTGRVGVTPREIVASWRDAGSIVRVATGVSPLDELCRGGLPMPWRVIVVGAPSAGKTALVVSVGKHLADQGVRVGLLAVDEEPDDVTVRLGQMLGYSVAALELRDQAALDELHEGLAHVGMRLYDGTWTVEAAAADVAAWAGGDGACGALLVDSIQTARAAACVSAASPREHVEAVVGAIRDVSMRHRMLVIATSEANRASYRSDESARDANDLAAGAESRAVEYGAQTQLVLRTPRGHSEVIHVRVAKNRRATVGEFWLRLDRDRHTLTPCSVPDVSGGAVVVDRQFARLDERVERDADGLAEVLEAHDWLGARDLRSAVKATGRRWGHARLKAAVASLLGDGRIDRTNDGRVRLRPRDPQEER